MCVWVPAADLLVEEGWEVNAKRIYRLYAEEGLIVRTKTRKQRAQRQRVAHGSALRPNQKWSMDFVAQRLPDGRWIRVLAVIDQFTRESLTLRADNTLSGEKVATALDKVVALRGAPESITVDNGTEFTSKTLDHWAYRNGVHLNFIRPGRPMENGYIESFNTGDPSNFVAGVERQAARRVPERGGVLQPARTQKLSPRRF